MHVNNETELNTSNLNNIHIINRTSGKNCSTSSTDSGVGLSDNSATYTTKSSSRRNDETKRTQDDKESEEDKAEAETQPQRISIEVEAKVNLNKKATRKTSPALSIRSTTISIVSIDEDAIDSSCIDSDSEAEPEDGCTVHKLGQQVTYPPQSDELTQLNKGLTVISRQVLPNGQVPSATSPDPDIIAEQLLNGNMSLATPTTPASAQQIGSIALTNTTDVTFGDKHYYEGPVTIQQILIDSRDKWKAAEGQDNPAFNPQAAPNNTGTKLDESCKEPAMCPFLPHTISRKAIIITAIFVALTISLGTILATTTNLFGKTLNKTNNDGKLVLVSVAEWDGKNTTGPLKPLKLPVEKVIIAHTVTEGCFTSDGCSYRAKFIQAYHMDILGWEQVGYNFMIGGDGRVYEGRGWDYVGAHTVPHNSISIGVAFIGDFDHMEPTEQQLKACLLLMDEGVRLKKLKPEYKIFGHRQLLATESPGKNLYKIIQTWQHFAKF